MIEKKKYVSYTYGRDLNEEGRKSVWREFRAHYFIIK